MTATTATRVEINGAEYFVHANVAHEIARLREALETAQAWLEIWAEHVGRCQGAMQCSCGLTNAQFEVVEALCPTAGGGEHG